MALVSLITIVVLQIFAAPKANAGVVYWTESAWVQVGYSPNPAFDCMNLAGQAAATQARNACVWNFGYAPYICATAPLLQVIPMGSWFDGYTVRCTAQAVIGVP